MAETYCVYKGKKYCAEIFDDYIEIVTNKKEEGFENYIDVVGTVHDDLFIKKVTFKEAEFVYNEKIYIRYKGDTFQLFSDVITVEDIKNDLFQIFTSSEKKANEFCFKKIEQFVFTKKINRAEIEELIIVQEQLLEDEQREKREIVLTGEKLDVFFDEKLR